MRHIKLFEGYLDEPEYRELTKEEHEDILGNLEDLEEPFNLKEFNWINNNFKNTNWYPGNWTNIKGMGNIELTSVMITDPKGVFYWQLNIYKLRDDWFIVYYKNTAHNIDQQIIQRYGWYKCDKLDGLIKLIEDKKIKEYEN